MCQDIYEYHEEQFDNAERFFRVHDNNDEYDRLMKAAAPMWRSEGVVSLQKGLMFLTRSVAQPTFF